MDRITRKELKSDKFAMEVGHTVEYVSEHRKQFVRYGSVALAVVVVVLGVSLYTRHQRAARQELLKAALRIQEANVGPPSGNEYLLTYPTQEERAKSASKAFSEVATKYPGSDEGTIAHYYLGVIAADDGKLNDAEKEWKTVVDSGNENYASLVKLALAQAYAATGRVADAEKVLRGLMEKPTVMVSKEQATLLLGQILAPTKPAEARALIEPLRSQRSAISRAAINALADMH